MTITAFYSRSVIIFRTAIATIAIPEIMGAVEAAVVVNAIVVVLRQAYLVTKFLPFSLLLLTLCSIQCDMFCFARAKNNGCFWGEQI